MTYDNILRLCDDPDVKDVIRFLREREVVHFQRFGECVRICKDKMDQKNIYLYNPAFDTEKVTPPVTPEVPEIPEPEIPEVDPDFTVNPDLEFPPETETPEPELDLDVEVKIAIPSETIRARYNGYNPPIYG